MLTNGQYICKIASYWQNLVKEKAAETKYHKNRLTNMYNKFKVKQKNAAVENELLSTIESIYTQFSNLRVHNMF